MRDQAILYLKGSFELQGNLLEDSLGGNIREMCTNIPRRKSVLICSLIRFRR